MTHFKSWDSKANDFSIGGWPLGWLKNTFPKNIHEIKQVNLSQDVLRPTKKCILI